MKKFEYKTEYVESSLMLEGVLNRMGNLGWELVNVLRGNNIYNYYLIFKRRKIITKQINK